MDVCSHEERSNQNRTCERISKSCTRVKEDHREKAKVVRTWDEGHVLRRMLDVPVPGKRRRGRQKTRWKDSCK